jgi:hypothetical protein
MALAATSDQHVASRRVPLLLIVADVVEASSENERLDGRNNGHEAASKKVHAIVVLY